MCSFRWIRYLLLPYERGWMWSKRCSLLASSSFKLLRTIWTFSVKWSLWFSTSFMRVSSWSRYEALNRFFTRSSAVSSWIFLSFSSYKNNMIWLIKMMLDKLLIDNGISCPCKKAKKIHCPWHSRSCPKNTNEIINNKMHVWLPKGK